MGMGRPKAPIPRLGPVPAVEGRSWHLHALLAKLQLRRADRGDDISALDAAAGRPTGLSATGHTHLRSRAFFPFPYTWKTRPPPLHRERRWETRTRERRENRGFGRGSVSLHALLCSCPASQLPPPSSGPSPRLCPPSTPCFTPSRGRQLAGRPLREKKTWFRTTVKSGFLQGNLLRNFGR